MIIIAMFLFCSAPTPGYFDEDDIPDFLITHLGGRSYPEYYYSEVTNKALYFI